VCFLGLIMFWHPLLLAIISADIVALLLLLAAALTAMRTAIYWQAQSADIRQLSLEAAVQTYSIQGRAAFWLFLFSTILLIFGIANVFHKDIPGAMCGTGVCQAMAGAGVKMLWYLGLLLLLTQLWYALDKVNRQLADMPLTEMSARLFLVLPPVAILALMQTYQAFADIQPHRPVDCCAVVYDQFQSLAQATHIAGLADSWWICAFAALSMMMVGLGVVMQTRVTDRPTLRIALATVSWLWLPVAALILVKVLSAYHYNVLHHHCPWCLFLAEHGLVGYPLYGAMGYIGLEAFTMLLLPGLAREYPDTRRATLDRCLRGARHITIAAAIFLILAVGPAVVWRIRFGVWMTTG
jgi:hypothetical protein